MNQFVKITLNSGREGSLLRRHPWIFSGAIKSVEGSPVDGQTVEVFTIDRQWMARGSYSSKSQIRVRILSFNLDEHVDQDLIKNRITGAIALRKDIADLAGTNAYRLIFAESDGLPGVIVDRYDDFLVCQFLSAGAEYWKDEIVSQLKAQWPCSGIFERSDSDSRLKEGYQDSVMTLTGDAPPPLIPIKEGPLHFLVDVYNGHKTGFYLDQRQNRALLMKYAENKEVLNAFSYTGGFGIAASVGKSSHVTNVDTSQETLDLARQNFQLNEADMDNIEFIQEDVFNLLRTFRDSRRQFDLIVLDPPKFVASASQLSGGTRGYKDINLLAFKLLRPGGILITFSCSGYVKPDLFQKIVADAAIDAGREAYVLEYLSQGPDHPVALNFPEGLYLKGMVCRVN
ncbi:MAG: class I SAM-dependent methyltransferase [Bacteroidales bacterium]|nr:class I SAM-dependent methyltransferase [Bacteroidales bacterium]